MKVITIRVAVLLGAASLLCSCAPQPRLVPYSEASFVPYRGSGTGKVTGHAYTVLRDKTVELGDNDEMGLMPDTAYTEEIGDRMFTKGQKLVPPDPRFTKYVKYVNSDGNGDFVFDHVKAGDYFVFCDLPFQTEEDETNDDGSTTQMEVWDRQWIYAQITVKDGETINVTNWNQGK
jgi:hypothetical protein